MTNPSHAEFWEQTLFGRYIPSAKIFPLIEKVRIHVVVDTVGNSLRGNPIYSLTIGDGPKTVLMWSQMHGNESTTTKALFDFINFVTSDHDLALALRSKLTIVAIPMLNPDGADAYTRSNAANIDLNRDFKNLSQPESQALFKTFEVVQPNYCFNLHDQRTIFGAGNTGKPATISFLAPSYNEACEINDTRQSAIQVIVAMNKSLQRSISGQVGRFDDAFNLNCVGDQFQSLGCPTILFEAGHYPGDYQREKTRQFLFEAIISGLRSISEGGMANEDIAEYFKIPPNFMNFYDIVYKDVKINYDGNEIITNFATQFHEALRNDEIVFTGVIEDVYFDHNVFGHLEIDCKGQEFQGLNTAPRIGEASNFSIGSTAFANGVPVN